MNNRLNRLAKRIGDRMEATGLSSLSFDEAGMLADMGADRAKLQQVLESFPTDGPRPSILEIYQRFYGGVQ